MNEASWASCRGSSGKGYGLGGCCGLLLHSVGAEPDLIVGGRLPNDPRSRRRRDGVPSGDASANAGGVCDAPLKLTRCGTSPWASAASTTDARITLDPNGPSRSSSRAVSGT